MISSYFQIPIKFRLWLFKQRPEGMTATSYFTKAVKNKI